LQAVRVCYSKENIKHVRISATPPFVRGCENATFKLMPMPGVPQIEILKQEAQLLIPSELPDIDIKDKDVLGETQGPTIGLIIKGANLGLISGK